MAIPALFGLFLAVLASAHAVVEITPREAVSRTGGTVRVLCKVNYAIDSCRMTVGGQQYILRPKDREGDVIYEGAGFGQGECGAVIKNIKEEWNGNVSCNLPPQSGNIELRASMRLIVAHAPTHPILIVPAKQYFAEGEVFETQCVSEHGRPAPTFKWFLDDEEILTGLHQLQIEPEPDTDLVTVRQNLTRTLKAEDAGRRLACRLYHEALSRPLEAGKQLVVQYPPKRTDGESGPITIFGLQLGSEGRLNVTVQASPEPQVEWTVGSHQLRAPQQSEDGMAIALAPTALGGGYYNVTLILTQVSKEDVERSYYLTLTNELGSEHLTVRISTMDEPAGVELDTGAIVGIVVAVLILLAAISLLVFAKATDRWCFAGGRQRDNTKSSGESTPAGDVLLTAPAARTSDTESAAGRRDRWARVRELGARVRGAVRGAVPERFRPRDKVTDTEQPAEAQDKPTEEKKGIVYAELALGDQPPATKPAPPPAEYAEIVYTAEQRPQETQQ